MTIDEVIAEVSKEWATGKWTSIVIAIGKPGKPLSFVGGASRHGNMLEDGTARQGLEVASGGVLSRLALSL